MEIVYKVGRAKSDAPDAPFTSLTARGAFQVTYRKGEGAQGTVGPLFVFTDEKQAVKYAQRCSINEETVPCVVMWRCQTPELFPPPAEIPWADTASQHTWEAFWKDPSVVPEGDELTGLVNIAPRSTQMCTLLFPQVRIFLRSWREIER